MGTARRSAIHRPPPRPGAVQLSVDKTYLFEGPAGPVTLADLFGDKRQLIVQHVRFGPDWDNPCPGS
jgi:predicted dithiol-disulfide oxidoreductase (DUF899 family)